MHGFPKKLSTLFSKKLSYSLRSLFLTQKRWSTAWSSLGWVGIGIWRHHVKYSRIFQQVSSSPPYTHTHPVRHSSLPLPPFILGYGSTQKAAKLMGAIQWLLKMPSPQCRRSVTRGFLPIFFHSADFCRHLYVVLLDPAPGGLKGNK